MEIDEWDCGTNVLIHDVDPAILRFGPLDELAQYAAEHEERIAS